MVNLDGGVVAKTKNPSVANSHGIGERERLVARVYLGISHHQVRHRRPPQTPPPLCNKIQVLKLKIKEKKW